MSEKRFKCVFVEDDEFGGTYRRLKDNETGIVHMTCDVADLLNFQNTQIKCLKEENEQLKEQVQILNKCCRHKSSDEYIKQAYADLNRREREKHSQGNATYIAKINQNKVIY